MDAVTGWNVGPARPSLSSFRAAFTVRATTVCGMRRVRRMCGVRRMRRTFRGRRMRRVRKIHRMRRMRRVRRGVRYEGCVLCVGCVDT